MDTKMQNKISFSTIFPLLLAIFIDNLNFSGSYPLISGMFTIHSDVLFSQGTSAQEINSYLALAYMAFPLGMLFATSFMDKIADAFGKKKTIVYSLVGIAIGFFLMALGVYQERVPLFIFGRLVTGLTSGLQPIAQSSIVQIAWARAKNVNMNLVVFSIMLGVTLGPLIGGVFADHDLFIAFNYFLPFFITGLLALGSAILIGFGFKEVNVFYKTQEESKEKMAMTLPILSLAFIFFLFQFGFANYYQFMLVKLSDEFNYLILELGGFAAFLGLGFMIGSLLIFPRIIKRFEIKKLTTFLLGFIALFMLLSSYTSSTLWIWSMALFLAMANILGYTTILMVFSSLVEEKHLKQVLKVAMYSVILGWFFSSFLALLIPAINIDHVIFIGGVCIAVSSGLMGFYSYKKI
jgi:MFS family permease